MSMVSDLAQYIDDQGVATLGTNLFVSYLPADVATSMAVLDTGGTEPDGYIPTKEPTFQVFIRSTDYETGKTLLDSIRALFHQLANTQIGDTYFYFILAISEGGHLGRDDSGRDTFSINFHCRTR